MQQNFLNYEGFRYLKLASSLCLVSLILYFLNFDNTTPNGGTWLGYTLGTISAAIIILLIWFGIRKRSYHSTAGTVKGWLSAHIYLGISLIITATLHTGFQFSWNVHMLAYVLMMLTIFSGFYGLYLYCVYPNKLDTHRNGINRLEMLREIQELDESSLSIANELSPDLHEVLLRSINKSRIGSSLWQQLTALKYGQDPLGGAEKLLKEYQQEVEEGTLLLDHNADQSSSEATMYYISNALNVIDSDKLEKVRELLETVGRKKSLVKQVRRDIQLKAILQFWLYFHVPLSIALLGALFIHIISVFYYW